MAYNAAFRTPGSASPLGRIAWAACPRSEEGIPLLVADPESYIAQMGDEWNAPLDSLGFEALCHLSRYLPQLGESRAPLRRAIRSLLRAHLDKRVPLAVEAGCSVGPDLRALARAADHVIGFDAYITPLRAASVHLQGKALAVPERQEGRSFNRSGTIRLRPAPRVSLVCGNALDPPFLADSVDVVLAINLVDNVPNPIDLIGQLDAILKPGGLLIVASPFNWIDTITSPSEQLGGGLDPAFEGMDSPEALRQLLRGKTPYHQHLDHKILGTQNVPWTLQEHNRCRVSYKVHVLASRKG